jgi:hypothetical protein
VEEKERQRRERKNLILDGVEWLEVIQYEIVGLSSTSFLTSTPQIQIEIQI